jgi:hypothetical protein
MERRRWICRRSKAARLPREYWNRNRTLGHLIDLHVCSHLKAFQFKYRHGRDERLSQLATQRDLAVRFGNAISIPIIDSITDQRSNKG